MKITGIVIAGGKSQRMGYDKKSIQYSGQSFLNRALELLSEVTDEVIISSNDDIDSDFHIIKDEIKGIGPIGGIYSGLKNIQNEMALIIPTDLPLLDKEILNQLLNSYDGKSLACVYEVDGQLEALVGLYHKNILGQIERQISSGEYKLQVLLEKVISQKISGDTFRRKFLNINSPKDLENLDNV